MKTVNKINSGGQYRRRTGVAVESTALAPLISLAVWPLPENATFVTPLPLEPSAEGVNSIGVSTPLNSIPKATLSLTLALLIVLSAAPSPKAIPTALPLKVFASAGVVPSAVWPMV